MANKTTKALRKRISAAARKGQDTVTHMKPLYNWHNISSDDYRKNPDACFTTQVFPVARVKGDGVNSVNKRRNSCQRVYLNRLESGKTASLTCHEPFLRHERMVFKNHQQYKDFEYTNPKSVAQPIAA